MFCTTFYSFKGGVGRTMALVNVANLLSAGGSRVLVVDFDLEAPGLSSYAPFLGPISEPGLVEFVRSYLDSGEAPDAREYIQERSWDGRPFWIMPAGRYLDADYARALASIVWKDVYDDHQGFLLLEDLKRQWRSIGFDYVLIDSRTGFSDVSGICTRQLPDAVVAMFVPTKQNLDGMAQVLASIRKAGPPTRPSRISVLLCASNVPIADNQEAELDRRLDVSLAQLGVGKFAATISHSDSLDVLEQGVVTKEQPGSRLARQYETLFRAVIALNLDDRRGAIEALDAAPAAFDEARRSNDVSALDALERRFVRVRRTFPDDPEIAWRSARLANLMLLRDEELASLNVAVTHGYEETRARTRRASVLAGNGDRAAAVEDLEWVFRHAPLSPFEAVPALDLLRSLRPDDWLGPVLSALSGGRPEPSAAATLIQHSITDRAALPSLIDASRRYVDEPSDDERGRARVRNAFTLLLVASGDFAGALELAGPRERLLAASDASEPFNAAVAEWGLVGEPPLDLFARSLAVIGPKAEAGDANLRQCLALCHAALGETDAAMADLAAAESRVAVQRSSFSCWRYLHVDAGDMLRDLGAMRAAFTRGEIAPPIIGTSQRR